MTNWLERILDGQTFESEDKTAKVSYRRNPSVDVTNFDLLPEEFIKRTDPTAKKKEIAAAIKMGLEVPGAMIVYSTSMQIK